MAQETLHNVDGFSNRGEAALTPVQRSRYIELQEQVQTRPGVLALMQANAARAAMLVELILSYVEEQAAAGVSIDEIPILTRFPAFQNTAERALSRLLEVMPKEEPSGLVEIQKIQKVLDDDIS